MSTRTTSFPSRPGFGDTHFEHGRTWKYVEPGIWKSAGGSGGGSGPDGEVTWGDVTGKPTEFPPSDHTHEQGDVDGLEDRLDQIEGSITDGGGFVDAPDDGKLYGRQSESWAEVVIPDGGASTWDEIAEKPTEFPPSAHGHEISEVSGLDDALTAAGAAPAWGEVTGKPTEFPPESHGHVIDDVSGLQDALDVAGGAPAWGDVTDKPTEFPPESHSHVVADITDFDPSDYIGEAPNDGKQYVRESEDWAEVSIPEPDTSSNLEGEWAYNSADAGAGEWTSRNADWLMPTTVTLHKTDASGYEHSFALMTVGDVIYVQGPAGGAEYEITAASVVADSATFEVGCLSRFGDFPSEGDTTYVTFIPQVRGGSVHIGENAPIAQEGDQWMEVPADGDATMWIYDGDKWLEQPSNGGSSTDLTGYATETYVGDAIAAIPPTDLSDYYTSTEADNAFQPKGDYIADAPSDGNLYIRKDGGWEVYVPSSGGGSYMKPVKQPVLVGEWTYDMKGNVGSEQFKEGTWYVAKNAETVRLTVPAGFKFVVSNMTTPNKSLKFDKFKIDGVQLWESGSPMGNKYKSTTYAEWFWANPQNFIAEDYVEFGSNGTYDTWWHLMGWFIAADGTRESEVLREEYFAAEEERLASMAATQEATDE